ncbi:MAG: hypothetical protein WBB25_07740 [Sulfitobacter sp.]
MNYFIYAGVFFFGALALLIEARRNYRESLRQAPFKTHPILEDAQIDELCTPTDGLYGFLIYSLLYLVSYIVILSSAELYDLIRSANLAKLEVGATTDWEGLGEDAFNLRGTEYAKPIFVSAFLIAVMSLSAMQPIENTVRSAAHRLAGIPRGVYRVIDALQTKQVMDAMETEGPLARHFREAMQANNAISDIGNYEHEITDALRVIDTIYPVISPNNRSRHFPFDEVEKLDDMSDKFYEEMKRFRNKIDHFTPTTDALIELHNDAFGIANDTKALFAVHYIRNHRSVKNIDISPRLTRIVTSIDRNYNPEKNSLAAAALAASLVSLFVVGALYYTWTDNALKIYPGSAKTEIREEWRAQPASIHYIPAPDIKVKGQDKELSKLRDVPFARPDECIRRHAQGRIAFGRQSPGAQPTDADNTGDQITFNTTCAEVLETATAQYLRNNHNEILYQTLWEVFQGLLVTIAAIGMAISGRGARMENASWNRNWSLNRIPFLRLFGACILPALAAVIAATTGELAKLFVDSDFNIPQSALVRFFDHNMTFLLMMMPLGFILAFGSIVILDRHSSLSKELTVLMLGGLTGLCTVGVLWLVIFVTYTHGVVDLGLFFTDRTRDLVILSSVPVTFILFFAAFIEATEEPETDARGRPVSDWLTVRIWRKLTGFRGRVVPATKGASP